MNEFPAETLHTRRAGRHEATLRHIVAFHSDVRPKPGAFESVACAKPFPGGTDATLWPGDTSAHLGHGAAARPR